MAGCKIEALAIIDGQAQELGTDGKAGFFRRIIVDLEANLVFNNNEVNHAACVDEIVGLTHGQNIVPLQRREDFGKIALLRFADEKDLAVRGFRRRSKLSDLQWMAPNRFAVNGPLQITIEIVIAQYADDHWGGGISKGPGGPINKLGKMIDEGGFDLIFCGRVLGTSKRPSQKGHAEEQSHCFYQHGAFQSCVVKPFNTYR